jgi:predicted phosphohydrolase
VNITIASDLHFEFHKAEYGWLPDIALNCDVIVLAGDIGVGDSACEAVLRIADAHPLSQIVWVAGNHEFYRQNIDKQIESYKRAFINHERIHFLENEKVVIGDVVFLGCTLWTGFDVFGQESVQDASLEAQVAIADFSLIQTGDDGKKFSPEDARNKFNVSYRWLMGELEKYDPSKVVVVSHFPPCLEASNKHFDKNVLTPYFQSNCQALIDNYQPAVWFYGHNHYSAKFRVGNTELISNQLGYPNEGHLSAYDPLVKIEID